MRLLIQQRENLKVSTSKVPLLLIFLAAVLYIVTKTLARCCGGGLGAE
jgi:hypothetical protein